ncbi:MAG: M23 family metallopeptidase [Myxococcota bacterium]|nr:M23 family metallopeptidase [Myxococcota bacterium]
MKSGFWLTLVGLPVLLVAIWFAFSRLEGSAPRITAPEEIVLGQSPQEIEIQISDEGSGIRSVSARLLHEAGSQSLLHEAYPGDLMMGGKDKDRRSTLSLNLDAAGGMAPDGKATLVLQVRDWSWRSGLAGNRAEISIPVLIDTRPPALRVESGLTYMHRGGAAAAVYSLEENDLVDGVRVGDSFFPGYPHPSGDPNRRVSIFAVPVEAPDKVRVEVVAWDRAGNEGAASFPAKILNRTFRESAIEIDEGFIEQVANPLARESRFEVSGPAETFRSGNEDLRVLNEIAIRESLAESNQDEPLWQGAFKQLSGSKVTSRFAEDRSYILNGSAISQARHYGFDLASVARAPVTATAHGVVAFAGPLGIYGRCVIIDHGLGVASLYGHLSEIQVEKGESVKAGQTLGRSGSTGLAGGDHLHFAILVGDDYVDPLEWWDSKWLRSHIGVRLEN